MSTSMACTTFSRLNRLFDLRWTRARPGGMAPSSRAASAGKKPSMSRASARREEASRSKSSIATHPTSSCRLVQKHAILQSAVGTAAWEGEMHKVSVVAAVCLSFLGMVSAAAAQSPTALNQYVVSGIDPNVLAESGYDRTEAGIPGQGGKYLIVATPGRADELRGKGATVRP